MLNRTEWTKFESLSGAPHENFEKLCRILIRTHYGSCGSFRALPNQPGIEFDLQLTQPCQPLGGSGRWYGWQCKYYPHGSLIKVKKDEIFRNLKTSCKEYPKLTDWVLWTRHKLNKSDQAWFRSLHKDFPQLKLHLYAEEDIEALLVGPALMYRESYFGGLIITQEFLKENHDLEASMFKKRHSVQLHYVGSTERTLQRYLGDPKYWKLNELANQLKERIIQIDTPITNSQIQKQISISELIYDGEKMVKLLNEIDNKLNNNGDLEKIKTLLKDLKTPYVHQEVLRKLRMARIPIVFAATNLVADLYKAISVLKKLETILNTSSIAILAKAGCGKSELAFHITRPTDQFIGGVVLHGKNLLQGKNLNDLIRDFSGLQTTIENFEQFVLALNSMGQRENRRIPIVIDGLNEAEDPRKLGDILSKTLRYLNKYPHILFVVTLRQGFSEQYLPEDFKTIYLDNDSDSLIHHYLNHYNIEITEELSSLWNFLEHPLTLKLYCETLDSVRDQSNSKIFPVSLIELFEKYFQSIAKRIAETSPLPMRIHESSVHVALLKIGKFLWEKNTRIIQREELCVQLGDNEPWRNYLLQSLESEGIFIDASFGNRRNRISVVYDLMAGQLIAKYLLKQEDIEDWLRDDSNVRKLNWLQEIERDRAGNEVHTLAYDISHALIGLIHTSHQQLWQILKKSSPEQLKKEFLLLTAKTAPNDIDREMIQELNTEARKSIEFSQKLYEQMSIFRYIPDHPLNARFLDQMLRDMDNVTRDISWSEWLRMNLRETIRDIESLEKRWIRNNDLCNHQDMNRAYWVMWTLTTTSHDLRDISTRVLYVLAQRLPADYFKLAIGSFSISDPYVPERMMAAAYGAALTQWSNSTEIQKLIVATAQKLQKMFGCFAEKLKHSILKHYCLGIIVLAKKVKPMNDSQMDINLDIPNISSFEYLLSPFDSPKSFSPEEIKKADKAAIRMDFGNYTIGTLVPNRANYDFHNKEYEDIRKLIVSRMLQLGYDPARFEASEKNINRRNYAQNFQVDRYGKKYSWIAFYEMYGHRFDNQKLPDYCGLYSMVDIDPTFPSSENSWEPAVPDIFGNQPIDMAHWIINGPSPNYTKLLAPLLEVDSAKRKWILLDGFIEETAKKDPRKIFTLLRGIFVNPADLDRLLQQYDDMDYPGNNAIPSAPNSYYTYAGEIPLGNPFNFQDFDCNTDTIDSERLGRSYKKEGPEIGVPIIRYIWEGSTVHCSDNIVFPSLQICRYFDLRYQGKCDLYDGSGEIGSLYRRVGSYRKPLYGNFAYLRADLFKEYLEKTNQKFVWLIWGERNKQFNIYDDRSLSYEYYKNNKHIHKQRSVWGMDIT